MGKLEGPKKHHDYHGDEASVPAKGSKRVIPKEHWEMHYDPTPHPKSTPGGAFTPRKSCDRPQPHTKINREDH